MRWRISSLDGESCLLSTLISFIVTWRLPVDYSYIAFEISDRCSVMKQSLIARGRRVLERWSAVVSHLGVKEDVHEKRGANSLAAYAFTLSL